MSQQKFVEHNISTYRKDAGLRTLRGRLFKCFFLRFYHTGVRRLRPVRRQRTLCGIRIKSFGTLFVSAPLCGDSDLCDPDRNQSAVVGCFERTPLCEDCDLCDQKQITANIAALRVLYHVWYGIAATEGRPQTTQPHTHQRHAAKQKKHGSYS